MVVTHVPFREPLGDQKKDSRKQVWKDGSQMMWAVTPDLMKGKAWGRQEGLTLTQPPVLQADLFWAKLPLRSEVFLAEPKPAQQVA